MLARKNRLTKQTDFKKVFERGRKLRSDFFQLRYGVNCLDYCRFAVVVSTKVSKRATKRNSIKRQIREVIKVNLSKFKQNFDIIISVLPGAGDQKLDILKEDLSVIFKKIT